MEKGQETIGRAAVAIGGFILMLGIVMLGMFSAAFVGIFDPDLFLSEQVQVIFVWVLLILGVIDLISGIILLYG